MPEANHLYPTCSSAPVRNAQPTGTCGVATPILSQLGEILRLTHLLSGNNPFSRFIEDLFIVRRSECLRVRKACCISHLLRNPVGQNIMVAIPEDAYGQKQWILVGTAVSESCWRESNKAWPSEPPVVATSV